MHTTVFPTEISRIGKLRGAEKLVNRSMCLVEKYPKLNGKRSVDAVIATHLLIGALLNERERKKYTLEDLNGLSWEIEYDKEKRKNQRRVIAERESGLILETLREKLNPLLIGEKKPRQMHAELVEMGITSIDLLENFVDHVPGKADGYRGLIERIGNICQESGCSEDILPMLENSLETVKGINLESADNVGSQLYMMHMSLYRADRILDAINNRNLFENSDIKNVRQIILALYIKRGIITTEGRCDLYKAHSILQSFDILDNELISTVKEKAEDVGDHILYRIIEAHDRLSKTLKEKRGGELIEGIINDIRQATNPVKK